MLLKSPLIIIIDWAGLSAACLTPTVLRQSWPLCFISSLCTCALYFLTRKLASGGMKLSYDTTKLTKVLRSMKTQQEGKYKERFVWLTCWLSSTNRMHYVQFLRVTGIMHALVFQWYDSPRNRRTAFNPHSDKNGLTTGEQVQPCCTLQSFLRCSLKEGLLRIVSQVSEMLRANNILSAV